MFKGLIIFYHLIIFFFHRYSTFCTKPGQKTIVKILLSRERTHIELDLLEGLPLKQLLLVPLFIRLMTPNGPIWSTDQKTVIMR